MRLNQQTFHESLDEMIEQSLGGFGHVQLIQAILVSLPLLFDAQQTFISVFTYAVPTWHCTDDTTCSSNLDICSLSRSSWSWDGPSDRTIASEWSLECASSIITGLPSSSFFMGCLLGGFAFSTLGDSCLGRKKLLFFSCLAMSISTSATVLSANIRMYSLLRFVCGFFHSSIMTTALVLLMEMVGKRWRGQEELTNKLDMYASMKELVMEKMALRRLLAAMALGFGVGMVYYGMLLGVGNLSRKNEFLYYGVYGLVILCYGLFVAYLLETRGMAIFDTLYEQESHDNTIVIVS
ncbi:Major facilitator [Theobroma cacao]|nr:Major facilitator [Theobroma cacao]